MNPPNINLSIILFFFLLMSLSLGVSKTSSIGITPIDLLHHKGGINGGHSRKLMGFNVVLDYDYAGPNPKHDPRGRRGGGGSKNP